MKRTHSIGTLGLVAMLAFNAGCGSEGSLANSGSNDWSFDGMNPAGARGGASAVTNGSSSANGSDAGKAPTSNVAGSGANPGTAGSPVASNGGAMGAGAGTSSGGAGTGAGAGSVSSSSYHQLANWVDPEANNPNHHGRIYFLGNAHKDENGAECTSCHGKNYEGDVGPACSSCHAEWRSSSCTFCHGTPGMMGSAPARGIWDESSSASLAVGRHTAHLSAGSSHQAFACTSCHQVPKGDDVDHTLGYKASADLATPGHHGDVVLTGTLPGMAWKVDATTGTPVSARGSCVGGCHSDGRGGAPAKTPYWAGGSWTTSCANCHSDRPKTGHHDHALGEGGTCANCHSGSSTNSYSADSHLNGKVEYLGTVAGQGMTLKADATCASGVRCNGTCHGNNEGHNNQCW